jgi:tyrosyl-tRNA synthetase
MEQEIQRQLELIKRGCVEIIAETELKKKLEESRKEKKPLIVKAGFDPTAPDIHLGHTVLLRKLAHFQELGHRVFFLIGDFTAMIGDPSGKTETRPPLSREEVLKNARTYQDQVSKILDLKKLEIIFNSEWLGKMSSYQVAELASRQTVARILERDDFLKRYKSGQDISFLEFLYPLFQAYDSVYLQADIELGGTDQKFNLLLGRTLQERYGQKPQIVITMPLLEGLDGKQKMSKSLGNYVGINEPAKEMFGKLMSIPDELMDKYFELLTNLPLKEIKSLHPMEAKKKLAGEITRQYHGQAQADKAKEEFEKVFQKRDIPQEIETLNIDVNDKISVYELLDLGLAKAGKIKSKSDFRRLVTQGAVEIDGEPIKDIEHKLNAGKEYLFKIGKKTFVKVALKKS